mmetsp:Transcript_1894/g.3541  ORF Transcript_1894/g.3541 Transcript_1894/m.3541 type:complete len:103 (-) Transcript_1894:22-330(-)
MYHGTANRSESSTGARANQVLVEEYNQWNEMSLLHRFTFDSTHADSSTLLLQLGIFCASGGPHQKLRLNINFLLSVLWVLQERSPIVNDFVMTLNDPNKSQC